MMDRHEKFNSTPVEKPNANHFEKLKAALGKKLLFIATLDHDYSSKVKRRKCSSPDSVNTSSTETCSNKSPTSSINSDISCNIDNDLNIKDEISNVVQGDNSKESQELRNNSALASNESSSLSSSINSDISSNTHNNLKTKQEISNEEQGNNSEVSQESGNSSVLAMLKAMFPDADESFITKESELLKNLNLFSKFIKDVMLSGSYPKKGEKSTVESDDDIEILFHCAVSSNGPADRLSRKKKSELSAVEVIDLTCDNNDSDEKTEWVDEHTALLLRIFPNADPVYLKDECEKMDCNQNTLNEFVLSKIEKNDMPTKFKYHKNFEMMEFLNYYSENLVIEEFLKAIPDPWTHFSNVERNGEKYKKHSVVYLKYVCKKSYMWDILDALSKNNYNLYLTYHDLKKNKWSRQISKNRNKHDRSSGQPNTIDLEFLQEVAFIENEEKIKAFIENQKLLGLSSMKSD